jgi:potassium channel LctB
MPVKKFKQRLDFFQTIIRATYLEMLLFWLLLNVVFMSAYFLLTLYHPAHGLNLPTDFSLLEHIYDCFYFSVATTTTLGYGDILPLGASKMLAILQASLGLMIFTVFVGKLVSEGDKK